MLKKVTSLAATVLLLALFTTVFGQEGATPVKPSMVSGDVVSISENSMVIATANGPIEAVLSSTTEYKKVSAMNPGLKSATASSLSDIGAGDKVLVTGIMAESGRSIPARAVFLMSKADIAKKHAKDAGEWRIRGITGRVVSVDAENKKIGVEMRTLAGSSSISLSPKDNVQYLRYAPGSIRFDEALDSSFDEIKTGDMVRALGDRSEDRSAFTAEQIITGAFQTIAGPVTSIDPDKNEIVIKDVRTNNEVTISVSATSILKLFPPEIAQRMAGPQAPSGGVRPAGDSPKPAGPGAGTRPGGGGGGGIDEMIDRFPDITVSDLKPGDMIAVSSTKDTPGKVIKAIKLLAGVELFMRKAPAATGRQRGQGVDGGFSIPGLDGIGFP